MNTVTVRYVEFAVIDDYLLLGWMVERPRGAAHPVFDAYRVLMVWPCQCKLVEPRA